MIANELRVGNWINSEGIWYATDQPYAQIAGVDLNGVIALQRDNSSSFDGGSVRDIQPIPLTSEWLERFGFALVKESPFEGLKMKYWVNNRVCLFFNKSEPFNTYLLGFADQRFGKYSVVTGDWIYHVHTLQNAFYAFTGTELTIKE